MHRVSSPRALTIILPVPLVIPAGSARPADPSRHPADPSRHPAEGSISPGWKSSAQRAEIQRQRSSTAVQQQPREPTGPPPSSRRRPGSPPGALGPVHDPVVPQTPLTIAPPTITAPQTAPLAPPRGHNQDSTPAHRRLPWRRPVFDARTTGVRVYNQVRTLRTP